MTAGCNKTLFTTEKLSPPAAISLNRQLNKPALDQLTHWATRHLLCAKEWNFVELRWMGIHSGRITLTFSFLPPFCLIQLLKARIAPLGANSFLPYWRASSSRVVLCCCCCFTPTVNSYGHVGWSIYLTTLFLGRIRPPKLLTSTKYTYFRQ